MKGFKNEGGPGNEQNKQAWDKLYQIFDTEPWKSDLQKGTDKNMKSLTDTVMKEWKDWGGEAPKAFGIGASTQKGSKGSSKGQETEGWHWEHAYRIDIKTNFNEDWFKRQFKSGLLNAAIRAIKTSAVSHAVQDVKAKGE